MYYVLHVQGVSKKAPPQKNFWNIFTSVKPFCVKFCNFVGNSYPHISANFWSFILIFHHMALIFPWVPIVFTLSSFEYASPRKCKCSFSEMTSFFSSSCVLVSSNCKQSITVRFLLLTFYWHRFKAWQDAPIVCHCKTIFPLVSLTKH